LNNHISLVEKGEKISSNLVTPLFTSGDDILTKLYALRPSGATALGPALALAVGMATKAAGAKIMICTGIENSWKILTK
jgi:hypothetical protein